MKGVLVLSTPQNAHNQTIRVTPSGFSRFRVGTERLPSHTDTGLVTWSPTGSARSSMRCVAWTVSGTTLSCWNG